MTLVGLVAEIKPGERRCALTPAGARELTAAGNDVLVEAGAGDGSGFTDADHTQAGASLAPDAATVWASADLLLKVKEPIAREYVRLRADQPCSRTCTWTVQPPRPWPFCSGGPAVA